MNRYICIHGHFYQPPRENPWLESLEMQDSAYPYHDWNERITAECYAPNAASRVIGGQGFIERIVNNYSKISFNFGPTLLSWMEHARPDIHAAIAEADRAGHANFSGHGPAMAQCYNHMIMPLANHRDRETQVIWGLRDFEHRFGRKPGGMWLPETAVNPDCLDVLAAHGIRFTILSPLQAARVRPIRCSQWTDVSGGRVDPSMAYECRLPSGRSIALFFYDGPISHAVAFDGLLDDGARFAARLVSGFSDKRTWPQLVHIATDGESYGHHHQFGEMALTFALEHIGLDDAARLTIYGEFLEKHPPTHIAEILENTAWSCAHGLERWRSDCGCNSGGHPGWNQRWRAPLRAAFDWMRDTLSVLYEYRGRELLTDPWAARNDYISVILNRSNDNTERFLAAHARRELKETEKITALKLLEMQRNAMLMYTSCGWFFDELSGLETVQIMRYAARALQLGEELFQMPLENQFLAMAQAARSNIPEYSDGAAIYTKMVKPSVVTLADATAHYALSSLFEKYPETARLYAFTIRHEEGHTQTNGAARLMLGRARVASSVTRESSDACYSAFYLDEHDLKARVKLAMSAEDYKALAANAREAFAKSDFDATTAILHGALGGKDYTPKSILGDEQQKIINIILKTTIEEAEAGFRRVYRFYEPLMAFLNEMRMPMPSVFNTTAEFVMNTTLFKAFSTPDMDIAHALHTMSNARKWGIKLDAAGLSYTLTGAIGTAAERACASPRDERLMRQFDALAGLALEPPLNVNFWKAQNAFYGVLMTEYPSIGKDAASGDQEAAALAELLKSLGNKLKVRVEPAPAR
ncbi:MAG: DUF3536 domain-containing protein [bacterium]|nr:DUF3536 domain-containing protein [Candidatus Sumerlaeota bacterium]